jgi:hypothetical protein
MMRFFGIQVGLLQVTLQNADSFVAHQLGQGEDVRAISQHGESKRPPEVMQGRHLNTSFICSTSKYSP